MSFELIRAAQSLVPFRMSHYGLSAAFKNSAISSCTRKLEFGAACDLMSRFCFHSYENVIGRISTLEMLTLMLKNFPERLILEYAGYFFIPLVMMLINDDSAVCRKMAAATVKLLLQGVNGKVKDELFDVVMTWSKQEKVKSLRLPFLPSVNLSSKMGFFASKFL